VTLAAAPLRPGISRCGLVPGLVVLVPLLPLLLLAACGSANTPTVTRRMNDEPVRGTFVSPYSYEHFVRGEVARATGDLETAAREFAMARSGPEEDPLVMSRLGEVLEELGRSEDADRMLRDAMNRFEDSEAVWLAMGRVAERRGDVTAAITAYEGAIVRAPRSETAPLALARLLEGAGVAGRAEAVLERYVRRSGGTVGAARAQLALAVRRSDAVGAVAAIRALLQIAPARHDEVVAVGRATLDAGRPMLAAQILDAAPLADPPLRLRALVAAHRLEEAEALLRSLRDEDIGGALVRSEVLLAVGQYEQAMMLADLVDEEAGDAGDPAAKHVGAKARLRLGRYAEAAELFAAVPAAARDHGAARLGLAEALIAGGASGAAAEVLATEDLDDPRLREALAMVRADRGDVRGATAVNGTRDDAEARALTARIADRAGQRQEAIAAWRRVPPDDPTLDRATRLRARAERLAAHGDRARAIEAFEALRRRTPEDRAAAARLAELRGNDPG